MSYAPEYDPDAVDWHPVGGYRDAAETAGNGPDYGAADSWVDCANVSAQADGIDIKDPCVSGPPAPWCKEECPFYAGKLACWEQEKAYGLDPIPTDDGDDVPF